ncbi:MAG: PAS domain S-box protein, partial [Candidatus Omnitrophota bacterium]
KNFYSGSEVVNRSEFRAFLDTDSLKSRYPGLVAIRFIERVPDREELAFVDSVKNDKSLSNAGYPGFSVQRIRVPGSYFSSRNEAYVIKYVEPYIGNEKMMGLDVASDPDRQKLYDRAWMSGEVSFGHITEWTSGKSAFTICLPVYANDKPAGTILERRDALRGFLDVVILSEEFFPEIFKQTTLFSKIGCAIYSGDIPSESEAKRAPVFANFIPLDRRGVQKKPAFGTRQIFKIEDSCWTLFFYATEDFRRAEVGSEMPLMILIQGTLLSFLVWGILYVLSVTRLNAVLIADRLTFDVQESEQRIRALAQSAMDAVISTDQREDIIFWNLGAQKAFGFTESEALGKPLKILFPPGSGVRPWGFKQHVRMAFGDSGGKVISLTCLKRDESEFPAEISMSSWKRGADDFLTVVVRDVSDQEKMRNDLRDSRDRYATLIEESPDPMISLDVFESICAVNSAAEGMSGRLRAELIGQSLKQVGFIMPESLETLRKEFEWSVSGQTRVPFPIDVRQSANAVRSYEVNLHVVRSREKIDSVLAVFRDITERKKIEKIQNVEHTVLRILASAVTEEDGAAGIVEYLCKAFHWAVGSLWLLDEQAGQLRAVFASDGAFEPYRAVTLQQACAKGVDLPGRVWEAQGSVWIENAALELGLARRPLASELRLQNAVGFPIFNQNDFMGVLELVGFGVGRPDEGFLNLFGMISQQVGQFLWRKRAEAQLKRAEQALGERERLSMVSQLAAGVAHEVKNPLTIILQGAEYLQRDKDLKDPVSLEVLDCMKQAVERADKIAKGLVELSKPESVSLQSEDIHAVIETSLLLIKNRIEHSGVRIIKQWQRDLPKAVIDRGKIEQVFINLLTNAIEAMVSGGGLLTVRTWSEGSAKKGRTVVVEIEDSGPGIPAHILPKLFTPFVTGKRAQGGSGLGLPIVRNIMETHKGKVAIENVPAGGAKVTLVFPCERDATVIGGTL